MEKRKWIWVDSLQLAAVYSGYQIRVYPSSHMQYTSPQEKTKVPVTESTTAYLLNNEVIECLQSLYVYPSTMDGPFLNLEPWCQLVLSGAAKPRSCGLFGMKRNLLFLSCQYLIQSTYGAGISINVHRKEYLSHAAPKINSRWIKDSTVKSKPTKCQGSKRVRADSLQEKINKRPIVVWKVVFSRMWGDRNSHMLFVGVWVDHI